MMNYRIESKNSSIIKDKRTKLRKRIHPNLVR